MDYGFILAESKSKQYALELAETGALGRALNLAGFFAKADWSAKEGDSDNKARACGSFIKEQRPNDPEPIVWDVAQILRRELGAEIIDETAIMLNGGRWANDPKVWN